MTHRTAKKILAQHHGNLRTAKRDRLARASAIALRKSACSQGACRPAVTSCPSGPTSPLAAAPWRGLFYCYTCRHAQAPLSSP